MISTMRALVVAIFIVLAVLACHVPTPQQQAEEVAHDLCACKRPADDTCVTAVTMLVGSASPACVDCVLTDQNACAAMLSDCVSLCIAAPGGF